MANIITQFSESELKDFIKSSVVEALQEHKPTERKPQKEILTIEEASEFLNLAKPTIYTHTSKGSISFFKRGKKLYFRRSELIKWIEEGRKNTVAEEQKTVEDYLKKKGGKS